MPAERRTLLPGFPANLRKKFSKIQKKFCKVTLEYFKGVRKKIFYKAFSSFNLCLRCYQYSESDEE